MPLETDSAMAGPSKRGQGPKDLSPGSRFSILNTVSDIEFPAPSQTRARNKRVNDSYQSHSFFSKNSRLEDLKSGPKFIIMERNEQDVKKTMNFVSPFTIQKSIELQAGAPKNVKRLRNGTLLIETVNKRQADKLYQLKVLGLDVNVKVYEHPTLNQSKGTIYCPELICETDEVILTELKAQHVTEVYRIKKMKNNELIDTGVFIVSFDLPELPEKLFVGYIICQVQLYIPNPRRCFKCQSFGHGAKFCNKEEVCGNCSELQHDPKPPVCRLAAKCKNCGGSHPSWDRKCPIFVREKGIQRIQTTNKISNYQARQRYAENAKTTPAAQTSTYTDVLTQSNTAASNTPSSPSLPKSPSTVIINPTIDTTINKISTTENHEIKTDTHTSDKSKSPSYISHKTDTFSTNTFTPNSDIQYYHLNSQPNIAINKTDTNTHSTEKIYTNTDLSTNSNTNKSNTTLYSSPHRFEHTDHTVDLTTQETNLLETSDINIDE